MSDLSTNLGAVADALDGRVTELARDIVERIRAEVSELAGLDGEQLAATLRQTATSALVTELSFMRHGRELPSACPPDAAEAARLAVMARLPATVVLQTHRIGHAIVWDAFVDEAERLGLPSARRKELLDAGSAFLFSYSDALAGFVEAEYESELHRLRASTEKQRVRAVLDVLEGRTQSLSNADYELADLHVGMIAWGSDAAQALRALAQLLDRRLLAVSATEGIVWAWLGSASPLGDRGLRTLEQFHPGDAWLACGEEGAGLEGFKRTHHQALESHRVAVRRLSPVTRYRRVALDSMAIRDERSAREFVELELGYLGSSERAAVLKQTLLAYFSCAQNAAATAAALGVHEQTVGQRLRAAEELIGCPVNSRRAELETALRIERLLG